MKQQELYKQLELEIVKEITTLFAIDYFSIGEVLFNGKIIVAIIKFNSMQTLTENWSKINSFLIAKYIVNIKDEFSKWNFYIFYLTSEQVGKPLKYEIENNKFSSRKIVIDDFKNEIFKEDIENIISEHITNDNIIINIESVKTKQFLKNELLFKIVDKYSNSERRKDKEGELSIVLDQIEKMISDEI